MKSNNAVTGVCLLEKPGMTHEQAMSVADALQKSYAAHLKNMDVMLDTKMYCLEMKLKGMEARMRAEIATTAAAQTYWMATLFSLTVLVGMCGLFVAVIVQ